YFTSAAGENPSDAELKAFLRQSLPEYMVPAAFMKLDSMPLTANGKIDRRALPAPDFTGGDSQEHTRAPRTPTEEVLAAIWADVLHIERVGADDNYFELGGHSLSATQVISRIRQAFQVELPVRELFEFPTVAGLAASIERRQRNQDGLQAPPLVPAS